MQIAKNLTDKIKENTLQSSSTPIPNALIQRLIALWALVESGLGGYMHALKIPFTGIVLGGSAVVILSLIAWFSEKPFRTLLRATLLVMLVKFTVSPHTSFAAYIAVGFQGLMAALFLSSKLPRFISLLSFFLLAMWESAAQKFILATLVFGKELWTALDESVAKMSSELNLPESWTQDFSWKVIGAYLGLYTLWALMLYGWTLGLPQRLENNKTRILSAAKKVFPQQIVADQQGKKKRRAFAFFFILLFIASSFFLNYGKEDALEKALILLFRTAAVVLFLLYVVNPLLRWLLRRNARSNKQKGAILAIVNELPALRKQLPVAWTLAKQKPKRWQRYPDFLQNLLVLSLFDNEQDLYI